MDFAPQLEDLGFCPFALITGKPCVLCGGTRASLALIRGDFYAAYRFNLSVVVLIAFFLLIVIRKFFAVYQLRNLKHIYPGQLVNELGDAIRKNYRLSLFIGLLWWIWNIYRW